MGISDLLKAKREGILRIAAKHGAHHVRVFGSVARGQARPDSDIDLLVDLDADRSLLDHAALMIELASFLGRKVDIATERGMRPHIREQVMLEAILL